VSRTREELFHPHLGRHQGNLGVDRRQLFSDKPKLEVVSVEEATYGIKRAADSQHISKAE